MRWTHGVGGLGVVGRPVNQTAWTDVAVLLRGTKQSVLDFSEGFQFIYLLILVNRSPPCWEKKNPTRQTNPLNNALLSLGPISRLHSSADKVNKLEL